MSHSIFGRVAPEFQDGEREVTFISGKTAGVSSERGGLAFFRCWTGRSVSEKRSVFSEHAKTPGNRENHVT